MYLETIVAIAATAAIGTGIVAVLALRLRGEEEQNLRSQKMIVNLRQEYANERTARLRACGERDTYFWALDGATNKLARRRRVQEKQRDAYETLIDALDQTRLENLALEHEKGEVVDLNRDLATRNQCLQNLLLRDRVITYLDGTGILCGAPIRNQG